MTDIVLSRDKPSASISVIFHLEGIASFWLMKFFLAYSFWFVNLYNHLKFIALASRGVFHCLFPLGFKPLWSGAVKVFHFWQVSQVLQVKH